MQKAHPRTPVRDFPVPPNVSYARVEPWSGEMAPPWSDVLWMAFVRGTFPRSFLAAPPVRSFDELWIAPTIPIPAAAPAPCKGMQCI
jgi:hypothetical protein